MERGQDVACATQQLVQENCMPPFLRKYLQRHQHPANRALHIVGLPVTFIVPAVVLLQGAPGWALASFLGGYALQFLGHALEGNDAGELIVVKKFLGRPYIAVVPRVVASRVAGMTSHRNHRSGSNFVE